MKRALVIFTFMCASRDQCRVIFTIVDVCNDVSAISYGRVWKNWVYSHLSPALHS